MLEEAQDAPLEDVLRSNFGLSQFRRGQREIISSVISGKDVMAVLPTGGGKSLCYQLPALVKQQLVIVISPLIALMKDQVSSLVDLKIPAGCLHSGQTEQEKKEVFRRLNEPGPFLLYLSPERAQKEGFHHWIRQRPIALFAIDEAHCVSQWGHDFRAEYAQLGILKTLRPDVPILALTASATPNVLYDIAQQLKITRAEKHVHGFYRPNLYYQVSLCSDEDDKKKMLVQSLQQTPQGRILVYCGTRKITAEVAEFLQEHFEGVSFYHAGLSEKMRTQRQEAYEDGHYRILVATNAFGMGIDHPDVRLVVHYQMPANIDSLYQEMGRAGRDGEDSTCIMLYARKDKGLQGFFIQQSEAPYAIKKARWSTFDALVDYCEGGECRHAEILTYYRDSQRITACGHCDICAPHSHRRIIRPMQRPTLSLRRAHSNKETHDSSSVSPSEAHRSAVQKASESKISKPKKTKAVDDEIILSGLEELRFQDLRTWRKSKAQELDVPAFIICSDKTLKQLALKNPQNLDSLKSIYGLGDAKIEQFGQDLLKQLGVK